jgi:protein PhnA
MDIDQTLLSRSEGKCELCGNKDSLITYNVDGQSLSGLEQSVLLCSNCQQQLDNTIALDENHWRCLNDSIWNLVPAIQVLVYRQLHALSNTDWAQGLLDMLYLEDDTLTWAQQGISHSADTEMTCQDSNGATLSAGETVTLIKDLVVKGANFTAKRGTAVKNISLTDSPEQIEGKVNGTRIVLLSQFLKKA